MPISKASSSAVAPGAKGQLVVGNATNDSGILSVGANGTVLTADSAEATGVKWAVAGGGGKNFSLLNTGGTSLSGVSTVTISGISNRDALLVLIQDASSTGASEWIQLRLNGDSGANYSSFGSITIPGASISSQSFGAIAYPNVNQFRFSRFSNNAASESSGSAMLWGCASAGLKTVNIGGGSTAGGGESQWQMWTQGVYNGSAITSITVNTSGGNNFDAGTVYVYGAA